METLGELADEGYDHIKGARRFIEREEQYCTEAGLDSTGGTVVGLDLPPFQQTALATGRLLTRCPRCGRALGSNQSFCTFFHPFDLPVFYRFACCLEFYLIVGMSPQCKLGIYLYHLNAMISFVDYEARPQDEIYYGDMTFQSWALNLLRYISGNWDPVVRYISESGDRTPTVLAGFVYNHGHQIFDEINALEFVAGNEAMRKKCRLLVGPKDYFQIHRLFPEIEPLDDCRLVAGDRWGEALCDMMVRRGLFALRPTANYHRGLAEKTARRMINCARQDCSPDFLARVRASAAHFPLVWITLRSHVRCWRGQEPGLARIIARIHGDFPECAVVFDGIPAERPAMEAIVRLLPSGLTWYDALDCTLSETITWTEHISFFIAPFANGTAFTSITNKPGVVHTHAQWGKSEPFCINRRENGVPALPVSGPVVHAPGKDIFSYDYTLDWRCVHAASMELISQIKETQP